MKKSRQTRVETGWETRRNLKGCDIGYALAAGSCEEASRVEACTVTAPDAITAFAVPNPNSPLAGLVGFFRSGSPSGYPAELITQSTSDWLMLFEPILSIVDGAKVKWLRVNCQRRFSVQN